jgi:hypothetical protein
LDLSTALNIATTAAVVGGVIFGAWQIRVATRARATQISLHLLEMLNSREMIQGTVALLDQPAGLSWDELRSRLGDNWRVVFNLINVLDGVGILVYRGEVAPQVSDDFFHHAVEQTWDKCRAAILELRQRPGRASAFQYLEWLAEMQSEYRTRAEKNSPSAYPRLRG